MTDLIRSCNAREAIRARVAQGRIPQWGPLLMVFVRPGLALFAQGLTLLLFRQLNVPSPAVTVRHGGRYMVR